MTRPARGAAAPRARAPTHWLADAGPARVPAVAQLPARAGVVVVGGGVAGAALAYWLARDGIEVLLLEARLPGWGASGRNAGLLLAARSPLEDPALLRSVLAAEGIDAEHAEPGHLALARTPAVWERMQQEIAARPADAPPLRLLTPDACRDLLGMRIDPGFLGGRWLPGGAVIHPARFVHGLLGAAVRHGAGFAPRTPVRAVLPRRGGVWVETARGRVRADQVVLACHGRSALLRGWFGRVLTPVRAQVLSTRPLPPVFPMGMAVDWGSLYWRQARGGAVVLGGCRGLDPAGETGARHTLHPAIQAELEAFLPQAFPGLPPVTVARRWAGVMDETPDGRPLAGRVPGARGVWVSAGFGGHGLPPALGVGRALARAIAAGAGPEGLEAMDPARWRGR
ncbi:MAG TPA: FAD-dependent oxidoreductase [Longimicrobium sp.]|nr:FAD-dependent oxidoreductase [Longimicrobium sp.]